MVSNVSVAIADPLAATTPWAPTFRVNRRAIAAGVALLVVFRLWYVHIRQLLPDEAVYWQWSRHLQWGYLDHPPMLAALIKLSTAVFGVSELGVRLPVVLLAWGAILVIVALVHALYHDVRITALVAAMWLTSPLWWTMGTIATPDTPAFFFSSCALACCLLAVKQEDGGGDSVRHAAAWWLGFGLFVGLGFLSKYTVVLLPASVGMALLTARRGWRVLRRPWPWLAGVIAAALFMPVVWWNYRHGWVSFAYQLHHGTDAVEQAPLKELASFVGGQALVWTPVLFVLALIVLWTWWGRLTGLWSGSSQPPLFEQVLLWSGTLPLVFFGYSATRSHSEMNWPGFAYVPLSLLTARFVAERWPQRFGWARLGCTVAAVIVVVLHVPELIFMTGAKPAALANMFESRPFAQIVEQNAHGLPVICNRHQDAGMASFYMTGKPDIWAVSCGSRPTAFDYMSGGPDLHALPRVAFVGWHVKEFCQQYGFEMAEGKQFEVPSVRKKKRFVLITELQRAGSAKGRAL